MFAKNKLLMSIILNTDSYKFSHWKQFPSGTETVYSYVEPRVRGVEIVNFGLQAFIKEYMLPKVTKEQVDFAEKIVLAHGLPFNRSGWMEIVNKHNGQLPIHIEALPEGTVFESRNCQIQIHNTDPNAYWLVSYIETALLRAIWYPSSVATISRNVKKVILDNLWDTCDNPEEQIPFKLHDFGARGASSFETALLGGAAHLINFMGTDTVSGLLGAFEYYGNWDNIQSDMYGFSIPASEHSTMTTWSSETSAMNNMLEVYGKEGGLLACVSDSYDFYNAVDKIWGETLKQKILDKGCTVVIRPDSGDPQEMVMYALNSLGKSFGFTINNKGYKVLHPAVRIIQGDGMTPVTIEQILRAMKASGWSGENVAFGMGGGLLQSLNRDTFKYAMKACAITIDGKTYDVSKNPITDPGKKSKKGILSVYEENGGWVTSNDRSKNQMITIFKNGQLFNETTFKEIRERAKVE